MEIQRNILDTVVLHRNSAHYASICRTWQTIIERKIFARLNVTQSRLPDFVDIGYCHRRLVKYIWLSIEPFEYGSPDCGGLAIDNWHQASTETVRNAIQNLVTQLSRWEPSGSLILDISVRAPSALRHSSGTTQYGPAVISEPCQRPEKAKPIQCSHWLHDSGLQDVTAYVFPRSTEFRKPKREPKPKPRHKMPKARAVTSLLLRQQTRRPWEPEVLEELLDLFPEVHEIHYEPWRDWRRMAQTPTNTCKA